MGGTVLMFIRYIDHPHAMWRLFRMSEFSTFRRSTLPVSILVALLGLAAPTSAQRIAWSPQPPLSPSGAAKTGGPTPPKTTEQPPYEKRPPGPGGQEGVHLLNKDSVKEAGAEGGILGSDTKTETKTTGLEKDARGGAGTGKAKGSAKEAEIKRSSKHNLQSGPKAGLSTLLLRRWIIYVIGVLAFLLLLWLSILSWLTYQGLATAKIKNNKLQKQFHEMSAELKNLAGNLRSQKTIQMQIQQLDNETVSRLAGLENSLSELQTGLKLQENRIFDIQSSHHVPDSFDRQKAVMVSPLTDQSASISEPKSTHDPAAILVQEYQEAFYRSDRSALRRMLPDELNITQHSEDALMKTSSIPTQLEIVKTGGSYLLLHRDGHHWLVPEFQILTSFTTNQLAKGIFSYERENISTAELRRPAEVREVNGLWEVVNMGVIAVPI